MEHYSVLMSVYQKERPEYLDEAIRSMLDQTVVTNDFVIVCDGPLSAELDAVLEHHQNRHPDIIRILRLPRNVGVGLAAREGLPLCKNELVAKMDADDISLPFRCARQLEAFARQKDLAIIGGYIEEFDSRTGCPFAVRSVPEDHDGIRKYARHRSPFNNVTVMYKKSAVLSVGGYRDLKRGEDYDLFIRLLIAGFRTANLPEILVRVRVDSDARRRRTSPDVFKSCSGIWWRAYRAGFISLWDLLFCLAGGLFLFLCPGRLKQLLYSLFLRNSVNSPSTQSNQGIRS